MNKEDLKIVFFGTPDFAVESLDRLNKHGFNIVGVVTMPDKPGGRSHRMIHSPVKQYAEVKGLHLLQPVNLKDPDFVDALRSLGADLFIVIAFRMLPQIVWQMPRLGTFNLHASLLPRYRGAAPINWAIINGDTVTGVTTFFLKHEIDTGDILRQESIEISPDDDLGTVHDKLMMLGADLTIDTVNHILADDLRPIPQDALLQDEVPTPAPKIFKDTCRIDWRKPAVDVHNLVRGLSPYPAAWTEIAQASADSLSNTDTLSIKVFKTRVCDQSPIADADPGTLYADQGRLMVKAADLWVEILSLQQQGKKRMDASDYLRGARLSNPKIVMD